MEKISYKTVEEYISSFTPEIKVILENIRSIIKDCIPEAKEKISYQMPTFEYYGNLVHFAAFKNHIGFYPTPNGVTIFEEELKQYKQGKGSVQFPLDQPIPYDLIKKIVEFRVKENEERVNNKLKKNKD